MNDMFCNHCGSGIDYPERGLVKFDGRFCDQQCSDDHGFLRSVFTLRGRAGVTLYRERERVAKAEKVVMTPHRRPIHCKIVRSVVVPDMMSLRILGRENAKSATDLRRALTASFAEGDEVVITLVEKGEKEA